jgi:hypothetical protein
MRRFLAVVVLFRLATLAAAQSVPKRMIDRCAQDGAWFYASNDKLSAPIVVERDGIILRLDRPNPKNADAVITVSDATHVLVQKQKDFDEAYGWLTVLSDRAFALTWNFNASATSTQLFRLMPNGGIVEDTELIPRAERMFTADAKRYCGNPGRNTTAIKWIDKDHLLLSIDAWASGFCESNFTEGFILDVSSHTIQRKLSDHELIDLPAVCTWNVVPIRKH